MKKLLAYKKSYVPHTISAQSFHHNSVTLGWHDHTVLGINGTRETTTNSVWFQTQDLLLLQVRGLIVCCISIADLLPLATQYTVFHLHSGSALTLGVCLN